MSLKEKKQNKKLFYNRAYNLRKTITQNTNFSRVMTKVYFHKIDKLNQFSYDSGISDNETLSMIKSLEYLLNARYYAFRKKNKN